MRLDRKIRFCAGAMAITMIASASMSATAQIVINEVVKDIRTFDAGTGAPENREFIELYNAGAQAVNIGGWTMNYWDMSLAAPAYTNFVDTIPANTMLAPGEYYVIGSSNLPETDLAIGAELLFLDLRSEERRVGKACSAR